GALPIWASPIGRSPSGSGSLRRRSRTTAPPSSPRWASNDGPRSPPGWRATAVAAGANTETEPPVTDTTRLRTAVEELLPTALEELATLVSMRSVADPEVEDPAELDKAANWVAAALGELGLETELARTPDGTRAVLARHTAAPAAVVGDAVPAGGDATRRRSRGGGPRRARQGRELGRGGAGRARPGNGPRPHP